MTDIYQLIINYLLDSPNHERKKSEIIKKFNINRNTFNWILIKLGKECLKKKYLLYENDTNRIIGILID